MLHACGYKLKIADWPNCWPSNKTYKGIFFLCVCHACACKHYAYMYESLSAVNNVNIMSIKVTASAVNNVNIMFMKVSAVNNVNIMSMNISAVNNVNMMSMKVKCSKQCQHYLCES